MEIDARRDWQRQVAALQKQLAWINLCEWGLWVLLAGVLTWLVDDRQLAVTDLARLDRRMAGDYAILLGVRNFLLLDACLIVLAHAARWHLRALLEQSQATGRAVQD